MTRWIGPLLPLVIAAVAVVAMLQGGGPQPETIAVTADGPRFATVAELFAAADVVVEGEIIDVDAGRAITDPARPDAGLVTALFQLDVATVFKGPEASRLTVEQEATLLDGTPIIVNDLTPNRVGDSGYWFLVEGPNDEFPYVALVNEQARILLDDLGTSRSLSPSSPAQFRTDLLELSAGG